MKKYNLSNKELDILTVLWESKKPLTAKEIHEENPDLVLSTIQISLKKLIKKNLIKVEEIVYSGTVLTRSYVPKIKKESFVVDQYQDLNLTLLLSEFIGNNSSDTLDEELDELADLIQKKKRNLK
ncbi:BlaI/MecI/CopY family transcriptional regulator [Enterococcus durans]|uniref:Predicted transcriptional regulator n=1 Tax=Enterococcus durans TaxID=53345 RepID=A0A377KK69_9ENTE|nr:BlaI/MecI/CopY family transcriptional regulator [Enterococcus durans]STP29605.1 Predicted transcriptional regulator [Enterococcus durans]